MQLQLKDLTLFLTKILWCATWLFDKTIFQFGQVKIADYNFGVLQTVVVDQIFQLMGEKI